MNRKRECHASNRGNLQPSKLDMLTKLERNELIMKICLHHNNGESMNFSFQITGTISIDKLSCLSHTLSRHLHTDPILSDSFPLVSSLDTSAFLLSVFPRHQSIISAWPTTHSAILNYLFLCILLRENRNFVCHYGVCVCHNEKRVPDEWQARQATQAILQVSSSKHNAKKITTRVRGPFHQSITVILSEEKREEKQFTKPTHVAVNLFRDQDRDRSRL